MRNRLAWGLAVVAASALGAAAISQDQSLQSGLAVGESAPAFDVYDVTGPNQGTELCYRWVYGPSPVVCVFTRANSAPLTSLVKQIDEQIAENPALKSFVVYLTDTDGEKEVVEALRKLASEHDVNNVPLTLMDTPEGPRSYKLSGDAEVTVLLWRGVNVRANHAFGPGDLSEDDVEKILADLPKILEQ